MKSAAFDDRPWHVVAEATEFACLLARLIASAKRPLVDSKRTVEPNDMRLASAALHGDDEAFARIVGRNQQAIAEQMRRFTRDLGVLEELVHDVFVEAYGSLKSYRGTAPLLHWLRKIAVRVGYRYWRNRDRIHGRTVPLAHLGDIPSHLQHALGAEQATELLAGLLDALAPPDRLVLTLLYWDGLTVRQAAELTGWSQAKVKVRAHRARKRLKRMLEQQEP